MFGLCPATMTPLSAPIGEGFWEEVEFQLVGEETACCSVAVPGLGYKQGTV